MRKLITGTAILMAIVFYQHAEAAQISGSSLQNFVIHVKYDHAGSIPNHIAYLTLMQKLVRAENNNAHAANIRSIRDHMSLDREHAELFLQFMLSSYSQIVSTNRALTTHMLCSDNKPKYNTNEAYQVLDVLDDIKETNLRRTYQRAQVNLGTRAAKRLNDWLSLIKLQNARQDSNNRQAWVHRNENVEEFMGQACNLVAAY